MTHSELAVTLLFYYSPFFIALICSAWDLARAVLSSRSLKRQTKHTTAYRTAGTNEPEGVEPDGQMSEWLAWNI